MKRDQVPVEEVVHRFRDGEGESVEVITRDLRARGINVSQGTVRNVLKDADASFAAQGSRRHGLTDLEELAERYDMGRGESLTKLAHEEGVDPKTLAAWLEEAGHKGPLPGKVLRLYERGATLAAVALTWGKSQEETRKALVNSGASLRKEDHLQRNGDDDVHGQGRPRRPGQGAAVTSTTTDGEHAAHDEWASMDGWARLAATLQFVHHGHTKRSIEELVHLVGAQKAGARVVERVEQKLAEHNIGHLPTKLPNDSTRQVLLYSKEGAAGLSYIIRLLHELATDGPAAAENATVHQLDSLLTAVTSVLNVADRNEARARRAATGRP